MKEITEQEAKFIWSLLPIWVKEIPSEEHNYDPTYFGTLSREGDIGVHNKVKRILGL
jgi:hypothetical protein